MFQCQLHILLLSPHRNLRHVLHPIPLVTQPANLFQILPAILLLDRPSNQFQYRPLFLFGNRRTSPLDNPSHEGQLSFRLPRFNLQSLPLPILLVRPLHPFYYLLHLFQLPLSPHLLHSLILTPLTLLREHLPTHITLLVRIHYIGVLL